MTKRDWAIELSALAVTMALWMSAMFQESPWWILFAMVGSGVVLYTLCYLALKH